MQQLEVPSKQLLNAQLYLGRGDVFLSLRRHVEQRGRLSTIDYDHRSLEFNQAFFVKNFLKCFFYIEYLKNVVGFDYSQAVDLGAGSGAFSFAAKFINPDIKILMLEKNCKQVQIGNGLSEIFGFQRDLSYRVCDVYKESVSPQLPRFISFFACESSKSASQFMPLLGSVAHIVDYPEVMRSRIIEQKSNGGEYSNYVCFQKAVPDCLQALVGQKLITISGVTLHGKDIERRSGARIVCKGMANT